MPAPAVTRLRFGATLDGAPVEEFGLTNLLGLTVRLTNFGARIISIRTPDRHGRLDDIVLGYATLSRYLDDPHYFGAVVGRVANRIAHARFSLDGASVRLTANDGPHHLHGGRQGFDRRVWEARILDLPVNVGVGFSYVSPDGEEGYPGTLHARVSYILNDANQLAVYYQGGSDRTTPVNLTQHAAFNLAGEGQGDVLGHELQIFADRMIPVDEGLIPTGELLPVDDGPFDFRTPATIGSRLKARHEQLRLAGGFDHTFVLTRNSAGLLPAAEVREPQSGRTLTVSTTEPGLHLYTGNFLSPDVAGKSGRPYTRHSGLCLETQHFPDAPNHSSFPSVMLRPETEYRSRTVFAFGATSI